MHAENVYVVDDDPGVLRAVTRLLHSCGHAASPFATPTEFLAQYDAESPGCLVLDIAMPGLDGLQLQQRLISDRATLALVFISGESDIQGSVQAMKAGAVDFLTKPFDDRQLLQAVDDALACSRRICETRRDLRELGKRFDSLTGREKEVFEHVVRGQLNKLIARDLGAAEKTVKVHRARVMQKMQADSLADLVRMAERMGIGAPVAPGAR